MSDMKICVTGANGYIGSHVVDYLVGREFDVVAVDFNKNNINSGAAFINANIFEYSDANSLYNLLQKPTHIIHLAWRNGFEHNNFSHIEDLKLHAKFFFDMVNCGVKSFSCMGSMHEIGYYEGCVDENTQCNPMSLYGISKNALRAILLNSVRTSKHETSVKWLRAYYIMGCDARNNSIFSKISKMEKEGKDKFPFTDGTSMFDFIQVTDLAKQIALGSIQNEVDGIIEVCSGKPRMIKDLVERYIKDNNYKIKPQYGMFKPRAYDSKIIYGNTTKIKMILDAVNE